MELSSGRAQGDPGRRKEPESTAVRRAGGNVTDGHSMLREGEDPN